MKNSHLTQRALARRWFGPAHHKIGGRVLYRIEDVHAYERESLRRETRKDMGVPLERAA